MALTSRTQRGSRRGPRRRCRGAGARGAAARRAAARGCSTAAAGAFDPATGARAAVRYAPQPWGTELEASVSGIPPGTACQIWAITASGATVLANPQGHALYGLARTG